jgi:hypothetical protein
MSQKMDDEQSDKAESPVHTRSSESLTSFGDDEHVPIKPASSTCSDVIGSPTLDAFIREYDTEPTYHDDSGKESNVEDSDSLIQSTQFSVGGYSDFEAGLGNQGRVIDQKEGERLTTEPPSFLPRLSSPFEEDVILNMDTSLPSSASSLGLSVFQVPERLIFSRRRPVDSLAVDHLSIPLVKHHTSLSEVVRRLHPGIALTINQSPSAPTFTDESGDSWNLFDEDDPWGSIGDILGIESTRSGADDMKNIMHDDRNSVGHAATDDATEDGY